MQFELLPGTTDRLRDRKGRPIWTVTAAAISDTEALRAENEGRQHQDELLLLVAEQPALSLTEMAEQLCWKTKTGQPNKSMVNRVLTALISERLVVRRRGKILLTKAGEKAAKEAAKN